MERRKRYDDRVLSCFALLSYLMIYTLLDCTRDPVNAHTSTCGCAKHQLFFAHIYTIIIINVYVFVYMCSTHMYVCTLVYFVFIILFFTLSNRAQQQSTQLNYIIKYKLGILYCFISCILYYMYDIIYLKQESFSNIFIYNWTGQKFLMQDIYLPILVLCI